MKRLSVFLLLLFMLVGCQSSLTLSSTSRAKYFTQASRGCHAGENVITLRSGAVVKAIRVRFRADSVSWMLPDSTLGGAPLSAVRSVQNTDYQRGQFEGACIGFAAGLMTGGLAASMAAERADTKQVAPFLLVGVSALIIGPFSGAAEGSARGSHLTVLVDSTANKKR